MLVGILLSGPTRGPSLHSSQIVFFFSWIFLFCVNSCVLCILCGGRAVSQTQISAACSPPQLACQYHGPWTILPANIWTLDLLDLSKQRLHFFICCKINIPLHHVTHFFNLCPPPFTNFYLCTSHAV